ncbi:hypothetical protein A0O36_01018 [Piscirickettsiaceae bacterium NZ-RLO1]|nr:hypothetical protein A0O36_01018 [Piscirickettsiaceae bacterium NZ-RLO1]
MDYAKEPVSYLNVLFFKWTFIATDMTYRF